MSNPYRPTYSTGLRGIKSVTEAGEVRLRIAERDGKQLENYSKQSTPIADGCI